MVLFSLGILLAIFAFYEWASHWSLHGGSPPGSEVLGFLAVIGGGITLIGGPLFILAGAFMLTGIPSASGIGRWASEGVVIIPMILIAVLLSGQVVRLATTPRAQTNSVQAQPPLPPDASLWDSIVGPANRQAQPPPPAPPLMIAPQIWRIDVKVILNFASGFAVAGALFSWTLCVIHILRAAAQNWSHQALSRRFLALFVAAWCIIAIWGFCYLDSTALERLTDPWFPGHTENEILFTSAPVILLGLLVWCLILLRQLMRHPGSAQIGSAVESSPK
jgi:hypothetical protein